MPKKELKTLKREAHFTCRYSFAIMHLRTESLSAAFRPSEIFMIISPF